MVNQLSGFYTCPSSLSISTHFERTNRTVTTESVGRGLHPHQTESSAFDPYELLAGLLMYGLITVIQQPTNRTRVAHAG